MNKRDRLHRRACCSTLINLSMDNGSIYIYIYFFFFFFLRNYIKALKYIGVTTHRWLSHDPIFNGEPDPELKVSDLIDEDTR